MNRKRKLFPPLFAASAALFLGISLFLAYKPSTPRPLVLRAMPVSLSEEAYRLELNSATAAELESLPGIGPVLAERILAQREENGPFTGPEDLLAVNGIGPKTLEAIEPYITFE